MKLENLENNNTNYIILTARLRIKKQMWLMFSLYVLFICYMPPFNRSPHHTCIIKLTYHDKHETRSIEVITMSTTRSKQQTVVTLVSGDMY